LNHLKILINESKMAVKGMGITPRAKSLLRSYLIESSWIAVRKDPEMQAYYRKHTGKLPNVIIVKVAHKLCRRILGIIKSGKPYEVNKNLVVE
jgi:transposase